MATALLECSVASTAEPMQVVREKSTFRIALLNVPVVEASLALEPDSTGAILVEGRARTVGIGGILYPIDNYYRALLDPTSGLPRWWKKTIAQADLKQSLAARADRELGLVDYGEHGTRQLAEGASWFIAIGATLHREVWEVGTCRTYPIEMEGRRLMMTLRGREEVERKVLGRTRRCIVVEAELVEPQPAGSDLLPRTDMLTYHLVDDDFSWSFVVTRESPAMLAAIELKRSPVSIRAELIRFERGGVELHRPRGGRRSHRRPRESKGDSVR